MEDWIDEQRLLAKGRMALEWIEAELLTYGALVQLAIVVAGVLLAFWLGPPLRRWLDARRDYSWTGGMIRRTCRLLARNSTPLIWFLFVWLAQIVYRGIGLQQHILRAATSLLLAWIVIRIVSLVIRNAFWSRSAAVFAWAVAALNIFGLLDEAEAVLQSLSISIENFSISALDVVELAVIVVILVWLAMAVGRLIDRQISRSHDLSLSSQVLIVKTSKIVLVALAVLAALDAVGVDLSSLALFGGALGVGLGFGLQKVVSNFVSGIILLADKSIKPGDVIAVEGTYGWIQSLNARYAQVLTRDGTEILIPNEELITTRVENWSHSDPLVRVKIPVGISYNSDPEKAIDLCLQAAEQVERVKKSPAPRCLVTGFGDSSVDLELRIWISDPQEGRANISSEVYLKIWKLFHEHGVEIPFPQRDIHLRSPAELTVRTRHDAGKD